MVYNECGGLLEMIVGGRQYNEAEVSNTRTTECFCAARIRLNTYDIFCPIHTCFVLFVIERQTNKEKVLNMYVCSFYCLI